MERLNRAEFERIRGIVADLYRQAYGTPKPVDCLKSYPPGDWLRSGMNATAAENLAAFKRQKTGAVAGCWVEVLPDLKSFGRDLIRSMSPHTSNRRKTRGENQWPR